MLPIVNRGLTLARDGKDVARLVIGGLEKRVGDPGVASFYSKTSIERVRVLGAEDLVVRNGVSNVSARRRGSARASGRRTLFKSCPAEAIEGASYLSSTVMDL